ncbi:MAG: hypothetical protein ACXWQR_10785 [Ktedonobacterales bacterium]
MSATVKRKLSATSAAQQAAFLLDLPDVKRLGIALAEAAADELAANESFARKVRTLYDAVDASEGKESASRSTTKYAAPIKQLIPVKPLEPGSVEITAAKPLDPYWLNDVFGSHQLRLALDGYPVSKLKEGAAMVEQRTGVKPSSKTKKTALIDYIVEHVTAGASL